jgi:hypothetical protein
MLERRPWWVQQGHEIIAVGLQPLHVPLLWGSNVSKDFTGLAGVQDLAVVIHKMPSSASFSYVVWRSSEDVQHHNQHGTRCICSVTMHTPLAVRSQRRCCCVSGGFQNSPHAASSTLCIGAALLTAD